MASKEQQTQLQQEAEILRLTLPLMSQHGVPTTPENYCIWYHYTAGDKPSLNAQIDQLLEEKKAFTRGLNEQLYQQFFSGLELDRIEQIRHEIQSSLAETTTSLCATGAEAGRFGKALEKLSAFDDTAQLSEDFIQLTAAVFEEARQIKVSFEKMKMDFQSRTLELDQLKGELEAMRRKASTDALTGLVNNTTFFEILEEERAKVTESQEHLCLVMLDIDHFKRVNDSYGHLVGDKVIRYVARTLKESIKGKDNAARYGGEEFAIILPDTPLNGALRLMEKIRKTVESSKLVRTGSREPIGRITVSAGVASYRPDEEIKNLVERADKALYRSKNSGRNRVTADTEQ